QGAECVIRLNDVENALGQYVLVLLACFEALVDRLDELRDVQEFGLAGRGVICRIIDWIRNRFCQRRAALRAARATLDESLISAVRALLVRCGGIVVQIGWFVFGLVESGRGGGGCRFIRWSCGTIDRRFRQRLLQPFNVRHCRGLLLCSEARKTFPEKFACVLPYILRERSSGVSVQS